MHNPSDNNCPRNADPRNESCGCDMPVRTSTFISCQRLRELLVGAFEGGSNYWYMIHSAELPPGLEKRDFHEGGKMQGEEYFHWSQLIPTTKGCALLIVDLFEDHTMPVVLNLLALRYGAQVMADKYPQHWANVISENDDAETSDVLLQCAVYGELVYG